MGERSPKRTQPGNGTALSAADSEAIVQVKVWLLGISPMVWRRVLVPSSCTLREMHGVIQVAMGWEGVHLFQFCLRAGRYGSWELSASSPEVTLTALQLRKGFRFTYEYDPNIPWRHEVRTTPLNASLWARTCHSTRRLVQSRFGGARSAPERLDPPRWAVPRRLVARRWRRL